MRNIFMLYMPPSNKEAMANYEATIRRKVALERIARFLSRNDVAALKDVFGDRGITVWGSRDSSKNRGFFDRMTAGDHLLIIEGRSIRFVGKVALKTVNPELSRELWTNRNPGSTEGWDLIYFIANPIEVDVPFRAFGELFGYKPHRQLRGLTRVGSPLLAEFYERYEDPYSVLLRLGAKQPVLEKPALADASEDVPLPLDEEMVLPGKQGSEHDLIQWKLASLGRKAGEKVWIPVADQKRLRNLYDFHDFEAEFTSGIDLPRNYVENIDVVWKEEFRINAAFEIEHSTAIYSGLLRFADLNVYAPNAPYPLFVVAPKARREQVRQQVVRPAFKRLDLPSKVRFLPYEAISEIDSFFGSATSGLSVGVMYGKSESFA